MSEDRKRWWWMRVTQNLESLVALKPGWDGYRGEPVSLQNAFLAIRILENLYSDSLPLPQIVPGAKGDLQVEWLTHVADIELHITAPNRVSAWIADEDTRPDGVECDLPTELSGIVERAKELMEKIADV